MEKNNMNGKSAVPKRRVVFGACGLTECEMLVPVGRARLRIHFTGGSSTGFGEVPARFVTDNAALQEAIRRSPQFRAGQIRIISERILP